MLNLKYGIDRSRVVTIFSFRNELLTILLIAIKALEVSLIQVISGDNPKAVPLKSMLKRPCGHSVRL